MDFVSRDGSQGVAGGAGLWSEGQVGDVECALAFLMGPFLLCLRWNAAPISPGSFTAALSVSGTMRGERREPEGEEAPRSIGT